MKAREPWFEESADSCSIVWRWLVLCLWFYELQSTTDFSWVLEDECTDSRINYLTCLLHTLYYELQTWHTLVCHASEHHSFQLSIRGWVYWTENKLLDLLMAYFKILYVSNKILCGEYWGIVFYASSPREGYWWLLNTWNERRHHLTTLFVEYLEFSFLT